METERLSRQELVEEHLEHHGIKGMRWGIRRQRGPDGTVGGSGSKAPKKPGKVAKAAKATGHATASTAKATGRAVAATGRATGNAAKKVSTARQDRRDKKELRRRIEATRPSHKTSTPTASAALRGMNDQQLREVLTRLDMEKRYKDLTAPPPKEKSAVAKIVSNSLSSAAQTQLTSVANQALGKGIESLTGGAFVYKAPKKK